MTIVLMLAGVFDLAFAVFHLRFWKVFRWHDELPKLSRANRGIMQVLNLCLTYVFVVMAAACLFMPDELISIRVGQFALGSFALFWALRTAYQPLFFGLKHPLSVGLFVAFIVGTAIHAIPLFGSL
jgi:hypothetical protein